VPFPAFWLRCAAQRHRSRSAGDGPELHGVRAALGGPGAGGDGRTAPATAKLRLMAGADVWLRPERSRNSGKALLSGTTANVSPFRQELTHRSHFTHAAVPGQELGAHL